MGLTSKLLTAGLTVCGAVGVAAITNKILEAQAGVLDTVLSGEERRFPWKYGDIFYQVKGDREARPLLLIHGFGPGASSFEWRKNFDTLAEQFHVYAIDLLGYGISDRPRINYTAETFVDLIGDFVREAIGRQTIVVAHGLPGAYVIANAYRRPQLFERLMLVTPSMTMLQEVVPGSTHAALKFILRAPIAGPFIYNMLTRRSAIRSLYGKQGYYNPELITDQLVNHTYSSAHQANSHLPMASLLSNHLNMDVYESLARLQQPIVAVWGREGVLTPIEAADTFKRVNPKIEVRMLDRASQQPQDEQAGQFNNLVREFAAQPVGQ